MHYRPDIDGLRALAILPVLLFHAGVGGLPGGFIGVDIFFVISGFLITSIIMAEMDAGRFNLWRFYERRARRILPALFLAFVLCIVLAPFILFPHQIKDLAQSIVAASVFASNIFFYLETDYFNEFTNKAPLLHTWTLAVEEQFYIAFPLLLLLCHRLGRRHLNLVISALFVISFLCAVLTVPQNASLAFYGTHTRAWELMAGCLIALNRAPLLQALNTLCPGTAQPRLYDAAGLLALAAIVLSMLCFTSQTPHPSWPTLVPVLATALLLLLGDATTITRRILSHRVPVGIGLLSYSLYMMHQPVISFLSHSPWGRVHAGDALYPVLALGLTLAVSLFSYYLVEKPIRYSKAVGQRTILISSVLLIGLFSALGLYGHVKNGFQAYFESRFRNDGGVVLVDVDREKSIITGFAGLLSAQYPETLDDFPAAATTRVLVIGDSMGHDAYLSLAHYKIEQRKDSLAVRVLAVDDECMAQFTADLSGNAGTTSCLDHADMTAIKRLIARSTAIILSAKWQETTYAPAFDLAAFLHGTYHAPVYVAGMVLFQDLTSLSMDFARAGITPATSRPRMYDNIRSDRAVINAKLRALVATNPDLHWIEKSDFFCDDIKHECRVFDDSGLPLIWDNAHLTLRAYTPYALFLLQNISGPAQK